MGRGEINEALELLKEKVYEKYAKF